MDSDSVPDTAIFVIELQEANKNEFFKNSFNLHHFSKIKSQKEVVRIQVFLTIFA
jgi:hypothetical protein